METLVVHELWLGIDLFRCSNPYRRNSGTAIRALVHAIGQSLPDQEQTSE
jgi:hypothetical protein